MMAWKKNALPILVCLLFGIAIGCKRSDNAESKDPKHMVEAYIRFLVPENEYKVQLVFMEGDSAANLRPIQLLQGVTWDGKALRTKNPGTPEFRYELLKSGPYTPRHVFGFVDENGKSRELMVEMEPVESFSIGPLISPASGATLTITGTALSEGEKLLLLFTDAQGNSHQLAFKGPSQTKSFELSPEMLRPLRPGKHELYLIKQQQRESKQHQHTVYSMVEWYSDIVVLEVR